MYSHFAHLSYFQRINNELKRIEEELAQSAANSNANSANSTSNSNQNLGNDNVGGIFNSTLTNLFVIVGFAAFAYTVKVVVRSLIE